MCLNNLSLASLRLNYMLIFQEETISSVVIILKTRIKELFLWDLSFLSRLSWDSEEGQLSSPSEENNAFSCLKETLY